MAPAAAAGQGETARDLITALVFAMLGAWLLHQATQIGDEFSIGTGMDAATYPELLALATLALAAFLALRPWWRRLVAAAPEPETEETRISARSWRVPAAFAAFVVYTYLLDTAGFLIATVPLLVVMMILAGERRPWLLLGVALLVTLVVQAIVFYSFSIVLPEGPWRLLYS